MPSTRKNFFNVAAEFRLTKKPTWLDVFRKKYDDPYPYHITLKTKTGFRGADVKFLKQALRDIVEKYHAPRIIFHRLFISTIKSGGCIMIKSKPSKTLTKLQKEIVKNFSKFGKHTSREYARFEKKFEPHITIGRHLTPQQLKEARNYLKGKNIRSEAMIQKIVLTTVRTDSFANWSNPKNKTVAKLKN